MKRRFGKRLLALTLTAAMVFSSQLIGYAKADNPTPGEVKLEFENMTVTNKSGGTSNEIRTGQAGFSGGGFLFMQDTKAGSTVPDLWSECTLNAPAGTYDMYVTNKDNPDRGIYSFSIDGSLVGTGDFYSADTAGAFIEHYIGKCTIKSDSATLKIAAAGANPSSNIRYALAADYLRLVPAAAEPETVTMEGEDLKMTAADYEGPLNGPMDLEGASGGKAYRFQPSSKGRYIEFTIPTPNPGSYSMIIATKTYNDRGSYEVAVNGTSVGTYDGYAAAASFVDLTIGDVTFDENSPAQTVIRFTGVDSNPLVTKESFSVIIDVLKLLAPGKVEKTTIYGVDSDSYRELSGAFTDGDNSGFENSATRVTSDKNACAVWSAYPPDVEINKAQNYLASIWVPGDAGAGKATLSITTTQGTWSKEVDFAGEAGWLKIATVAAVGGTALTASLNLSSGKMVATNLKLEETTAKADPVTPSGGGDSDKDINILVNQLGYDTEKSKRATIVNVEDGAEFLVKDAVTHMTVYSGTVEKNIADFSDFMPETRGEFYLMCTGVRSYNFAIGKYLMQSLSAVNALDFMNQSRQDPKYLVGGNTGYGWRDSHQFSFELNSLVLQYMANPSLYDNLPFNIDSPDKCEYEELQTQDEPDMIWLIQFAALRYYDWGVNKNIDLHMLIKEQLAYFLYIYPEISEYVEEETYEKIRDFTIAQWGVSTCNKQWYPVANSNHDLYSVQTVFGGLKGSQPPTHSIVPNLMMYEVAKRDGLGSDEAQKFFDAAYQNTEYTLNEIDINDPYFAKGQRMSEHIILEALTYFQELYPDKAPSGLKAKIQSWAVKTIARSDNMWDTRMAVSMVAGDSEYQYHGGSNAGQNLSKDYWTGAAYAIDDGQNPAPKNEPGNTAGMQAITYAAARVLDDSATVKRLKEIGDSAIDDMYGRNPTGRAYFYHFTRDFEGGDLGWWVQHKGGFGALEGLPGVIDANPPESCYPYAPQNYNTGYTEGWVAYNTAWNASLAYSASADTTLSIDKASAKPGETVKVTLRAPLNLDHEKVETAQVVVKNTVDGTRQKVTLTEDGEDGYTFSGAIILPDATTILEVSYGFGLFRQVQEIASIGDDYVAVESITLDKDTMTIGKGESGTVNVALIAPDSASFKNVNWSSKDDTVATVSDKGVVTGVGVGEPEIVAASSSNPDVKAVCRVTVTAPTPVSLLPTILTSTIKPYDTTQISIAQVLLSDNTKVPFTGTDIRYSPENRDLIRVDENGLVTGKRAGTAKVAVTATVDGKTLKGEVSVTVSIKSNQTVSTEFLKADTASSMPDAVADTTAGGGFSGPSVLTFKPGATGNWVEITLPATEARNFQLELRAKYYNSYGVYQMYLDGVKLGEPIDFSIGKLGSYSTLDLGVTTLKAGTHTLRFEGVSGGSNANGFDLAVDFLTLTEQYEQYPPPADRQPLLTLLSESRSLLQGAVAGDKNGQYPQSAIDDFTNAVNAAIAVSELDEPNEAIITLAVNNLTLAKTSFQSLQIVVNTDDLQKAIDEAAEIEKNLDNYQEPGKQEFLDALAAARAQLQVPGTQIEIKKATDDLIYTTKALVKIPEISVTALQHVVNNAEKLYKEIDRYMETGKQEFLDALTVAKAQLSSPTSQADVDKSTTDLHTAMMNLRLTPSKDALEALLTEAKTIALEKYTEESAAALTSAIDAAQEVYDNPLSDRTHIDKAQKTLLAAIAGLTPFEESEKPSEPEKPAESSQPEDSSQLEDNTSSDDQANPDDESKDDDGSSASKPASGGSTATGDTWPVTLLTLAAVSLAAVVVLKRKNK